MTCRVFLVGEGPTDIGDLADFPGYREGDEGFLQPILRQMVAGRADLSFFDGRKLTALKRLTRREPPHHLQTRKAAQALALASVLGADALVFSCDVDKAHGAAKAVERRRRLSELRKSIEAGFAHVRATDPEAARVVTAAAVPARMIEAWAWPIARRSPSSSTRTRPPSTTVRPRSCGATRTTGTPTIPSASGGAPPRIGSRTRRSASARGPTCSNVRAGRASRRSRATWRRR